MGHDTLPAHSKRDRALELVLRLRDNPLFAGLSADEVLPIATITEQKSFPAGEVIFKEGAAGEHLYLISRGRVEVLRDDKHLNELGVGECFGEMALLDSAPRSATVRALDDVSLVTIAREDFMDLLDVYPAIARAIALVLAGRLRNRRG